MLRAARMIDGNGGAPITNAVVVIVDNKITEVGASGQVRVPANARLVDLGDVTLLPGLIDSHTHLIGRVLGDPDGDTGNRQRLRIVRRNPRCRSRDGDADGRLHDSIRNVGAPDV